MYTSQVFVVQSRLVYLSVCIYVSTQSKSTQTYMLYLSMYLRTYLWWQYVESENFTHHSHSSVSCKGTSLNARYLVDINYRLYIQSRLYRYRHLRPETSTFQRHMIFLSRPANFRRPSLSQPVRLELTRFSAKFGSTILLFLWVKGTSCDVHTHQTFPFSTETKTADPISSSKIIFHLQVGELRAGRFDEHDPRIQLYIFCFSHFSSTVINQFGRSQASFCPRT